MHRYAILIAVKSFLLENVHQAGHSSKANIKDYMYPAVVDNYDVIELIKKKGLLNGIEDVAIISEVQESPEQANVAIFHFSFTTVTLFQNKYLTFIYVG